MLLCLFVFVLCVFVFVVQADAQTIILRPAAVPLKGEVGQSVTQTLTLQNESDVPLEFDLVAQDVVVREGKRVFVEAGKLPGSIAATAVMQPQRVRVEAHRSASAQVMFTLPRDMQHRAAVALFRGRTLLEAGARKATMSLGTLFTFQVSERVAVSGRLDAKPPTGSSNASFEGFLSNDGSEPVVPSGLVAVLDGRGRLLGKVAFTPRRLLPGESANVNAEYVGDLDTGTYRAVATFDVDGKPLTLVAPLHVP